MSADWQPTACILCECNCGIVVQTDGRSLAKIRGDKNHPATAGYTCNKALRLDHYQNSRTRLTSPMRRRAGIASCTGMWKLGQRSECSRRASRTWRAAR